MQALTRAQTGNVLRGNYEERTALKNALEIHEFYPEKSKTSAAEPVKVANNVKKEDKETSQQDIDSLFG